MRVIWQKSKNNPWTTLRSKSTKKESVTDTKRTTELREEQTEIETSKHEFETRMPAEQQEDEVYTILPDNNMIQEGNKSKQGKINDSHENIEYMETPSKLKKVFDVASISLRSSFSRSFGEVLKQHMPYKELGDDRGDKTKKADFPLLVDDEFDLIANRKSKELLEGMTEEKENFTGTKYTPGNRQTLESFIASENRSYEPAQKSNQGLHSNRFIDETESFHPELGELKSAQDKYYDYAEKYDNDDDYNQTSQSQTLETEIFGDDTTMMTKDATALRYALRDGGCCVTREGALSKAALVMSNLKKINCEGRPEIKQKSLVVKDDNYDDVLPVELAMEGEKTLIQVDGENVSGVMYLRGRRVYRLDRNKLKGKRFFSSRRVYEPVEGASNALILPKERSTGLEDVQENLPPDVQVTRLTKSKKLSKKANETSKSVGISDKRAVIASPNNNKTKEYLPTQKKKPTSSKTDTDEAGGYFADDDNDDQLTKRSQSSRSHRYLNPGKSIYWLKVGDDVESRLTKHNVAPLKTIQWIKMGPDAE